MKHTKVFTVTVVDHRQTKDGSELKLISTEGELHTIPTIIGFNELKGNLPVGTVLKVTYTTNPRALKELPKDASYKLLCMEVISVPH